MDITDPAVRHQLLIDAGVLVAAPPGRELVLWTPEPEPPRELELVELIRRHEQLRAAGVPVVPTPTFTVPVLARAVLMLAWTLLVAVVMAGVGVVVAGVRSCWHVLTGR